MKEKQLKDRTKKDYLLEKDYLCQICQRSSYILIQGKAIGFAPLASFRKQYKNGMK
jgi:hypothetical protein